VRAFIVWGGRGSCEYILKYHSCVIAACFWVSWSRVNDIMYEKQCSRKRMQQLKKASIRQKFFVDRVINVWNALLSTTNFASLNVFLGIALTRLICLVFLVCNIFFYLCDRICTQ